MVVHELIDGEAVIIHLGAGFYYNLEKTGAAIWHLISQGSSENEIIEIISKETHSESSQISGAVNKFLDELKKEELITADPSPSTESSKKNIPAELRNAKFQTPVMHKYTDMQDFFQADPIHDVDDKGWPNRKPNPDLGHDQNPK